MDVLHVSPHPDDELIGAPATLMALRDEGHRIVNFAASLGAPASAERRRAELEEACRRAGFELVVAEEPFGRMSSTPAVGRDAAEDRLAEELAGVLEAGHFELVLSPSPHDRHPGHELVARAVRAVLGRGRGPARWWLWRLWGELPLPTTIVPFGPERMAEIIHALEAHHGELERNDYRALVEGRAREVRVLAAELVFGFGSRGLDQPYAELTTEVVLDHDQRLLGQPRLLDPGAPLASPSEIDVSWWVNAPSVTQRLSAGLLASPARL
jgi:LmbE family N-acetylglucosaminyl deacetylase